ncbi:MAG: hypothetical protein HXS54_06045 [Theionarchaea archaeon]|nr:hypothetical protein [Theionarchaea archaeon]DBA34821.1 TPA_asm: hypothetical protein vir521_00027 [Caudoviricetes sp. vir521]
MKEFKMPESKYKIPANHKPYTVCEICKSEECNACNAERIDLRVDKKNLDDSYEIPLLTKEGVIKALEWTEWDTTTKITVLYVIPSKKRNTAKVIDITEEFKDEIEKYMEVE